MIYNWGGTDQVASLLEGEGDTRPHGASWLLDYKKTHTLREVKFLEL
jgi:hypothetical protein